MTVAALETEKASMRDTNLRRAVEAMREGMLVQSATGEITDCNPAAGRLLGVEPGQLLGRTLGDLGCTFVRGDDSPLAVADFPSRRTPTSVTATVAPVRRATRWLSVEATPLRVTPSSPPDAAVTSLSDVSAVRTAKQQLERLEALRREVQSLALLGSWELDLVTNHLAWSQQIFAMFEIDPARFEASYEAFLATVHPDDREMVNEAYLASVKSRTPYDIVHRLRFSDGRIRWVREKCQTFYDQDGRPLRSVGTVQDITDKHRAMERLELTQRLARVGSWETDLSTFQSVWSDETYRIFGLAPGIEASYPRFLAAVHPDDRARVDAHRQESFRSGQGYELDHRVVWPDKTTRHVRSRVNIVLDARGKSRRVEGTVQDITGLVQAELRLRNILDGIAVFVGLFDLEGRLVEVNRPPLEVAALTRDQVLGQPIWETYWWSHSQEVAEQMRHAQVQAASGAVVRLDLVARVGEGRSITVDLTLSPLRDADGRVEGVIGSGVDITERLAAEREVLESEARFHAAFHGNPIAMGIRRLRDDVAVELNGGFEKLFGVKRADVLGKAVAGFDFYLDPETRGPILLKAERREPIQNLEVRFAGHDGAVRHALMTVAPLVLRGEDCSLGSFVDITERKRAEAALLEREAHLDAVFTHTTDAMMLLAVTADGTHRVIAANPAFIERLRNFVDVHESDVIGLTFEQIGLEVYKRPPEQFAASRAAIERVIETCRPFGFEVAMPFPGRMLFVEVMLVPITDDTGKCVQILWSSHDVTARKQTDAENRRALAEKETLLREVHHRVKNNLQVISSLLHFQSKKLTSPAEQTALRELRQRIFAMTLVHERLYRSRDVARVDFADYARSLVRELGLSIGLRDAVKLQVEVEPVLLPIELALPSGMLVSELVTNVLKYAFPDGRAGVATVRVRDLGASIEICVEDDGVGFPPGFDFAVAGSFGWELIRALVLQLDATLEAKSGEQGAHVCVTFLKAPGKEIAA